MRRHDLRIPCAVEENLASTCISRDSGVELGLEIVAKVLAFGHLCRDAATSNKSGDLSSHGRPWVCSHRGLLQAASGVRLLTLAATNCEICEGTSVRAGQECPTLPVCTNLGCSDLLDVILSTRTCFSICAYSSLQHNETHLLPRLSCIPTTCQTGQATRCPRTRLPASATGR